MFRAMPPNHNYQSPLNQHTHEIHLLQAGYLLDLDDLPSQQVSPAPCPSPVPLARRYFSCSFFCLLFGLTPSVDLPLEVPLTPAFSVSRFQPSGSTVRTSVLNFSLIIVGRCLPKRSCRSTISLLRRTNCFLPRHVRLLPDIRKHLRGAVSTALKARLVYAILLSCFGCRLLRSRCGWVFSASTLEDTLRIFRHTTHSSFVKSQLVQFDNLPLKCHSHRALLDDHCSGTEHDFQSAFVQLYHSPLAIQDVQNVL